MAAGQSFATEKSRTPKSTSRSFFILVIAAVAAISFVAGTRSDQIMAAVGPVFGLKVPKGAIDLSSVENTYKQLSANFDGNLDTQALVDGASRGLVAAAGDQFTVYLDAKDAKEFSDDLSGTVGGGIGAAIGVRSGQPTITRILPGNPAEAVGLKAGDVIVSINGTSADGWTAEQAADKVRGDVGTSVKMTIKRGDETKEFSLTRAEVNNPSVTTEVRDGIGIMTLTRFDESTGDQARAAAEQFKQQGVKGVVLDLRGNGGGFLSAAQAVASLWVEKDKTVVTERTNGKVADTQKATGNPLLAGLPTVVLVDSSSASASEIVTGALKDYKLATIVGEKTYGKGTVQQVIDLGGGTQLKVTIARWYTPNGHNITGQGIEPDQKVTQTQADLDAGRDPQLDAALGKLGG